MFTWQDLLIKYFNAYRSDATRYIVFAGVLYLVFYVWKRRDWLRLKIQDKYPKNEDIYREIGYSFLSIAVFSLVATGVFMARKMGYTRIYTDFSEHSVAYFIFSIVFFIIAHDTYFYWTHRFMHWKKIYRFVHLIHHKSHNPTPWAAFAFHPLEAVVEVGILPLVVFLVPVHHFAILAWVLYMMGMNVLGHLGFELFPEGFASGKITKWHNTSVHHNQHHKKVTCNYGLYFNFWDRIMGTNHAEYETEYDRVKEKSRQKDSETPITVGA